MEALKRLIYHLFVKKDAVVIWYCEDLREVPFTTDVSIPETKYCDVQWGISLFYEVMEVPCLEDLKTTNYWWDWSEITPILWPLGTVLRIPEHSVFWFKLKAFCLQTSYSAVFAWTECDTIEDYCRNLLLCSFVLGIADPMWLEDLSVI